MGPSCCARTAVPGCSTTATSGGGPGSATPSSSHGSESELSPLAWGSMRIATWNVNSIKQRVPRLLPWLDERRPDVACLQETKLSDDAFRGLLGDELADHGYAVAVHGEATSNGVAILSRVGLDDVVAGLGGEPGFPHPERARCPLRAAGSGWSP